MTDTAAVGGSYETPLTFEGDEIELDEKTLEKMVKEKLMQEEVYTKTNAPKPSGKRPKMAIGTVPTAKDATTNVYNTPELEVERGNGGVSDMSVDGVEGVGESVDTELMDGMKKGAEERAKGVPPKDPTLGGDFEIKECKYRLGGDKILTEENVVRLLEQNQDKLKGTTFSISDSHGSSITLEWLNEEADIVSGGFSKINERHERQVKLFTWRG